MDIIIVGAGIAGLTAAIALRGNGHRVTIFEQSRLNQETGAAIFLPPNANGLLRTHGFVPEKWGANFTLEWQFLSLDGTIEVHETFNEAEYPHPWQMIHRQKLHSGLKELAQDPTRPGIPVDIKLSSRVMSVNADEATVVFEDGSNAKGDVVIGADGVHSVVRNVIQQKYGTTITPFSSGTNAFRFMISRKALVDDPMIKPTVGQQNTLMLWHGDGVKLVCYPCNDNETVNFVAIHSSELSNAEGNEWNSEGSKDTMTSIFSKLEPGVRRAFEIVDPSKVKLHPLLDMDHLPGWTNGRVALIGDAAHPLLPHLAQGGALAIEDAISISVFLPHDTKQAEIPGRLALYEQARRTRADIIQATSRMRKSTLTEIEDTNPVKPLTREQTFLHDEIDHSTKILRAHLHEIVA